MAHDRERALAAGCDDFFSKPVNLKGLLERIEQLLPDGDDTRMEEHEVDRS